MGKYHSKFEKRLVEGPLSEFEYHPKEHIEYIRPAEKKTYQPDFKFGRFLIESKGRFRNKEEACKYKHVNTALKDTNYVLIFILERPNVPFPGSKKRKDGSRRTHEEWLDNLEIEYYYESEIEKLLRRVKNDYKAR